MKNVFIEMEKLKNLHSGLGQFNFHLGKELVQQNKDFHLHFYVPGNRMNIFGNQPTYIEHKSIHRYFSPVPKNMQVWHGTHQQSNYLPSGKSTKKILTVHDLNFLYKYKGWKLRRAIRNLQSLMDKVDRVVTISAFAASDLQQHIRLKGKEPVVIYNGNALAVHEDAQQPAWMPVGPFLFTMGIFSARKNFHVLPGMLAGLKDIKLVMAGNMKTSYTHLIREEIKKYGVEDRVVLAGEINDEERYWLYKNCLGFVFPSLAEGFGLPVVEAMSMGKPVFLSTASSLPEVGGDQAYYWQNFDASEMAAVVEKGLYKCSNNPALAEAFKKHASQFSWKKSAGDYLRLYQEVISD